MYNYNNNIDAHINTFKFYCATQYFHNKFVSRKQYFYDTKFFYDNYTLWISNYYICIYFRNISNMLFGDVRFYYYGM